jgi:ribonuclease P protein component
LVLCVAPAEHDLTRVAVTASRRIGPAVVRNRVRRRVRESVRQRYDRLARGRDLIFIARSPSATADWPSLDGAAVDLLRRSGVISARLSADRSDA